MALLLFHLYSAETSAQEAVRRSSRTVIPSAASLFSSSDQERRSGSRERSRDQFVQGWELDMSPLSIKGKLLGLFFFPPWRPIAETFTESSWKVRFCECWVGSSSAFGAFDMKSIVMSHWRVVREANVLWEFKFLYLCTVWIVLTFCHCEQF